MSSFIFDNLLLRNQIATRTVATEPHLHGSGSGDWSFCVLGFRVAAPSIQEPPRTLYPTPEVCWGSSFCTHEALHDRQGLEVLSTHLRGVILLIEKFLHVCFFQNLRLGLLHGLGCLGFRFSDFPFFLGGGVAWDGTRYPPLTEV